MSAVGINVVRARSAASGLNMLAWNPQDNATVVNDVALLGDFVGEAAPTVALLNELDTEIRLLSDLFTTRADLAVSADNFPSRAAYLAYMEKVNDAYVDATNALLGSLGNTINAATSGAQFASSVGEDVINEIFDFIAGDVLNFYNGGDGESLPYGQLGAAGFEAFRWLRWGGEVADIPVFSNGLPGQSLSRLLSRFGPTAAAGRWLGGPGAVTTFRWLGVAGGLYATGAGAYNLYQQGNPITAFQEEGAGYVADVGSTAFAASSTLLLMAPAAAPVLVPIVVGSAIIWAGAEVWDRWGNDISEWAGEEWDAFVHDAGVVWDATTDVASAAVDWGGDRIDDATEALSDTRDVIVDAGGDIVEFGGDVLDAGGDLLSMGGDVVGALNPTSWF